MDPRLQSALVVADGMAGVGQGLRRAVLQLQLDLSFQRRRVHGMREGKLIDAFLQRRIQRILVELAAAQSRRERRGAEFEFGFFQSDTGGDRRLRVERDLVVRAHRPVIGWSKDEAAVAGPFPGARQFGFHDQTLRRIAYVLDRRGRTAEVEAKRMHDHFRFGRVVGQRGCLHGDLDGVRAHRRRPGGQPVAERGDNQQRGQSAKILAGFSPDASRRHGNPARRLPVEPPENPSPKARIGLRRVELRRSRRVRRRTG